MSKQARDSFIITIVSYFGAAIGYFNKILLFPNLLAENQVGLLNVMLAIAAVYAQFAAMGGTNITIKFFPYFRNNQKQHNGFFMWGVVFVGTGFALATAIFVLFKTQISAQYIDNAPLLVDYFYLLIPLSLMVLYYNYFEAYLRSLYNTIFASFALDVVLRISIAAILGLLFLGVVDFDTFVYLLVITYSVPTLMLAIYIIKLGEWHWNISFSSPLRRLRKIIPVYGIYSVLNNSSSLILTTVDGMMLAAIYSLEGAGIYITMMYIPSVMLIPYRAIGKANGPLIADYWNQGNIEGIKQIYRKVSSVNLFVGGWIFLLLYVNFGNLMYMLPPSYAEGFMVFTIIGFARLFDMFTGLNGFILVTSNKYRTDLIFTILLGTLTILLNYIFIPKWGLEGAASATLISVIIYNSIRTSYVYKVFKIHPFEVKQFKVALIIAVGWLAQWQLPFVSHFIVDLFIRSAMVTVAIGGIIWYFSIFPEMKQMSLDMLRKITKK